MGLLLRKLAKGRRVTRSKKKQKRSSTDRTVGSSISERGWRQSSVVIGSVVAVAGLLIAAASYFWPRQPPFAAPEHPELGTLNLSYAESSSYYPKNGALPRGNPPDFAPDRLTSHCDLWDEWARDVKAAPVASSAQLGVYAGRTSPMTIVDLKVVVYQRRPMVGNQRILCRYGAGPVEGPRLSINLDSPARKVPMDTDGDFHPDTTFPDSVFVVDEKKAESISIDMSGTPGMVYEYSLIVTTVENGTAPKERKLGSRERPLLIAILGEQEINSIDFDWSTRLGGWYRASINSPGIEIGER